MVLYLMKRKNRKLQPTVRNGMSYTNIVEIIENYFQKNIVITDPKNELKNS